jgi:hypothetical protein
MRITFQKAMLFPLGAIDAEQIGEHSKLTV